MRGRTGSVERRCTSICGNRNQFATCIGCQLVNTPLLDSRVSQIGHERSSPRSVRASATDGEQPSAVVGRIGAIGQLQPFATRIRIGV